MPARPFALSCLLALALAGTAALPTPSAARTPPGGPPQDKSAPDKQVADPVRSDRSAQGSLVPVSPKGLSKTDPLVRRLYGPGVFVMDSLGNLNVGEVKGLEYVVSQRFRATRSGPVRSVATYWADGPGYASGNGGVIRIRIFPDDGSNLHLPAMKQAPLAVGEYRPGLVGGRHVRSKFSDKVAMEGEGKLVEGRLYHVVYDNLDPLPELNYLGVNCVATVAENGRPSRWISPLDWAALYSATPRGTHQGPDWRDITSTPHNGSSYYAPILQVELDDGSVIGNTNMETGNVDGRQWTVTATTPARERFTPRSDRMISGFAVQTASTIPGQLRWQFKDGSKVLSEGTIDDTTSSYRLSDGLGHKTGVLGWRDIALPTPVPLTAGTVYDLEFTAVGPSSWRFPDQRNGAAYGYRWPASFDESQAQVRLGGRWLNANHWSWISQSSGANWRVVLFEAPPTFKK